MTDANSLPHYNCALLASVFHHATDQIVVWGQMGPQKGAMVHRDHTRRHKPGMKSRTSMQSCYHLRWMIEHQLFFFCKGARTFKTVGLIMLPFCQLLPKSLNGSSWNLRGGSGAARTQPTECKPTECPVVYLLIFLSNDENKEELKEVG